MHEVLELLVELVDGRVVALAVYEDVVLPGPVPLFFPSFQSVWKTVSSTKTHSGNYTDSPAFDSVTMVCIAGRGDSEVACPSQR